MTKPIATMEEYMLDSRRELMRYANLIVLLVLTLVGCDQASMMKMMTSSEDEQVAKNYINLLRQGKFEQIEKDLDPSIKTANVHDALVKMAAFIAASGPARWRRAGMICFVAAFILAIILRVFATDTRLSMRFSQPRPAARFAVAELYR